VINVAARSLWSAETTNPRTPLLIDPRVQPFKKLKVENSTKLATSALKMNNQCY
jgi:hypothetical protein